MAPLADYEEQTKSKNRIKNMVISTMRRVICYNQPIYDDARLEASEYTGLQLGVSHATSALVEVQEHYDNAVILILDDDSQLHFKYMHEEQTLVEVQ